MKSDYLPFDIIVNRADKERVAAVVAENAKSGEVIGAGSGSTSYLTLLALAKRVEEGKIENISVVPTSFEITWAARSSKIRTVGPQSLDWLFDGADAVDPEGNLIKGRGGALLREKILFGLTSRKLIAADSSKMVSSLNGLPVPIEIHPAVYPSLLPALNSLGTDEVVLRTGSGKDGPVITESGNLLLDVRFPEVFPGLEKEINAIPGVFENGLFQGYNPQVVSGK